MTIDNDAESKSEPLVVDTSALLCRYLPDARRRFVGEVMARHAHLVVSSLARTELLLALHQAAGEPERHRTLWDDVGRDWDLFWEVPLDRRCMARATEVGARYGLSVANAIHLAAADRLPRPVAFLTLDRRQIPGAADLGFRVRSPVDG
ncbi:MAG: type II toxin-antitoxin system VapC family toxin [Acidimicrobiales bacterium]